MITFLLFVSKIRLRQPLRQKLFILGGIEINKGTRNLQTSYLHNYNLLIYDAHVEDSPEIQQKLKGAFFYNRFFFVSSCQT
jgi:hypothetical protein